MGRNNPETIRRWREKNRDHVLEHGREYYAKHRERIIEWQRQNRAKNRDAILAQRREYRAANRDEILRKRRERYAENHEKERQQRNEWRSKNRARVAEQKRAASYGITVERLREIVAPGQCALCGGRDKLHVDHCHATNRVRGLLCHWCNTGIGSFRDDPARLERAAAYLRASQAAPT